MKGFNWKRFLICFACIQIVGAVFVAIWEFIPYENIGFSMWVASIALLFPGDLISQSIVERFLWMKGIPLTALQTISMLSGILINAIIWFSLGYLIARKRIISTA